MSPEPSASSTLPGYKTVDKSPFWNLGGGHVCPLDILAELLPKGPWTTGKVCSWQALRDLGKWGIAQIVYADGWLPNAPPGGCGYLRRGGCLGFTSHLQALIIVILSLSRSTGEYQLELPQKGYHLLQPGSQAVIAHHGIREHLIKLLIKCGTSHSEWPSPHLGLHQELPNATFCSLPGAQSR